MSKFTKCFLSAMVLVCASSQAFADTPVQSDSFVDSVGVNVHLGNGKSLYYTNFPLIQSSLVNLGVRHVRDGLVDTNWQGFYDRHNALGALGIKGTFLTSATQTNALLQSWPSRVSQSFEGYEAPNEMDEVSGGIATLQSFLPVLYNARNTGSAPNAYIVGPSLTQPASYPALGNQSAYIDAGAIHDYFAGRNPGTSGWGPVNSQGHYLGSLSYDLDQEPLVSGTKPIFSSETGYNNSTSYINYVDEATSAIYMPRLLLESWLHGIKRSYLYEFATDIDNPSEDFGLMRSDGTYKPSFTALQNLLNLLTDKGPAFTPTPLNYTISGGDSYLHKLLLQKRDGTYFLVLWIEKPGWQPDKHYAIAVAPEAVTLNTSAAFTSAKSLQWDKTGNVATTVLSGGASFALTVTDKIQVIQLGNSSTWQLTLAANPAAGGTVTASPATTGNLYAPGTSVIVTATPNSGYAFSGFSGAVNSSSNSVTVTSNTSVTETANFTCVYTPLVASLTFNTSASSKWDQITTGNACSAAPVASASWIAASMSGNSLVVSVQANSGTARTGNVTLGGTVISVSQASNSPANSKSVLATVASNVPGTITYIDKVGKLPGGTAQLSGATHTVATNPIQNVAGTIYLFQQWTSGLSGTASSQTINTPTANVTFASQFVAAHFLKAYATSGGTVTVSSPGTAINSTAYYYPTDTVMLTATPNSGCKFVSWAGTTTGSSTILSLGMSSNYVETGKFSCK